MDLKKFEEDLFKELVRLREVHGWHFKFNHRKNHAAGQTRYFLGSLERWFGTTFWNIDKKGDRSNPVLGLWFSGKSKMQFCLEARCNVSYGDAQQRVAFILIEQLKSLQVDLRLETDEATRSSIKRTKWFSKNYGDAADLLEALEDNLQSIIPQIDKRIGDLQLSNPKFNARRLNAHDTERYNSTLNLVYSSQPLPHYSEFSYYIVGSKYGPGNDMYPAFRDTNRIAVGYADSVSLSDLYLQGENVIVNALKAAGEENSSYNALKKFLRIRAGDYVAIKSDGSPKGNQAYLKVVAIGRIEEQEEGLYRYDPNHLVHSLPIRWIATDLSDEHQLGYGKTVHKLTNRNHVNTIFGNYLNVSAVTLSGSKMKALNQILYGPPGTGKTFSTIRRAVNIANPTFVPADRNTLRQEYLRLKAAGRITFTTFHQSLSYEDFVEGLKPKLESEDDIDGVEYAIVKGIFRNVCDAALRSILANRPSQATKTALDFDRKYELLADEVQNRLLEEGEYQLESRNGGHVMVESISDRGNFRIKHRDGTRVYTVGKERLTRLHLGLKERGTAVTNIHDTFRDIIGGSNSSAYWAVLNAVRNYKSAGEGAKQSVAPTPTKDILDTLTEADYRQPDINNHVLIIDEINRGNVSAILGELITLLEPDKRLGAAEELTVTLPYSRDEFGVPPNLYIIGTMNTADRSVEALDAALRRRFVFEEVGPDPEVIREVLGEEGVNIDVDGKPVNLVKLLTLLNDRIAALKDSDHLLGHSYFLKVKSWQDLSAVMVDRVVPLLREYFFGNYAQLQLVVGNGFCQAKGTEDVKFGKVDDPGVEDYTSELRRYTFPRPVNSDGVEDAEKLKDFLTRMEGRS